jgi:hypothetical protein
LVREAVRRGLSGSIRYTHLELPSLVPGDSGTHPTLFETVGMAAEAFEGTLTDLYLPNRRERKGK